MKKALMMAALVAIAAAPALGNHFPYQSTPPYAVPTAGGGVPDPVDVPGKEYTDFFDEDVNHLADPLQVLMWDGQAGVDDTFDYTGSGVFDEEVDALANGGDVLFAEVTSDLCAMLFSVTSLGDIWFERRGTPVGGMWASGAATGGVPVPNHINHIGVDDTDALEVWGPEGSNDADNFSMSGDVFGVSVYNYNSGAHTSTALFTQAQIAGAIGRPDLETMIDLDAMMLDGENIMFSIAPVDIYDGGEIWVWDGVTPGGAAFLFHGGHLWDTLFPVATTYGLPSENVNALDAVPEPATMGLLVVGGLALLRRRK